MDDNEEGYDIDKFWWVLIICLTIAWLGSYAIWSERNQFLWKESHTTRMHIATEGEINAGYLTNQVWHTHQQ